MCCGFSRSIHFHPFFPMKYPALPWLSFLLVPVSHLLAVSTENFPMANWQIQENLVFFANFPFYRVIFSGADFPHGNPTKKNILNVTIEYHRTEDTPHVKQLLGHQARALRTEGS
jgi:hypothetical protein